MYKLEIANTFVLWYINKVVLYIYFVLKIKSTISPQSGPSMIMIYKVLPCLFKGYTKEKQNEVVYGDKEAT